jgi:hypothetical protein
MDWNSGAGVQAARESRQQNGGGRGPMNAGLRNESPTLPAGLQCRQAEPPPENSTLETEKNSNVTTAAWSARKLRLEIKRTINLLTSASELYRCPI